MKVELFRDHELVACHTRAQEPGKWRTVKDHLPPEAQAFLRQTPAWCRQVARRVGPSCRSLIDVLLAHEVVERLPAANGVLRLEMSFGAARLESACRRALAFGDPRYRAVKTTLHRGLDQVALQEEAFHRLSATYAGVGRFHRTFSDPSSPRRPS